MSAFAKTLNTLKSLIWRNDSQWQRTAFLFVVVMFFITCLNVGVPLLFKYLIQLLTVKSDTSQLTLLLVSYGIAWGVTQVSSQLKSHTVVMFLERVHNNFSMRLFKHIHSLSYRFHVERNTGALTSIIERAYNGVESLIWGLFVFMIPTVLEIVFALSVVALFCGVQYALAMAAVFSVYSAISIIGLGTSQDTHRMHAKKRTVSKAHMIDSLLNFAAIKYFASQQQEYTKYKRLLDEQEQAARLAHKQVYYMQMVQSVVLGLGLGGMTWYTGRAVVAGTIDISSFVLINSYTMLFISPLSYFGHILQQIRKGFIDLEDAINLLEKKPEVLDKPHALTVKTEAVAVSFKDVSFAYEKERPILHDISFTIPQGKMVALVGETGSGKSTIWRLLVRLYDSTSGTILFNDHDIHDITLTSLRKHIGVVSQDISLFNNTLLYNITYGNPLATDKELQDVLRVAHLEEFIKTLPDGLNTQVGEQGYRVSGGEKQRIALARSLIKKPALYILDEATSSLDTHTEKEILLKINEFSSGATKLVIAHRLSTVCDADEILVVDKGRIVERGTHGNLLTQKGVYYKLWQKQTEVELSPSLTKENYATYSRRDI